MVQGNTMQHDLDVRIAQLELELCQLKSERNALSPIFRLPPELLCKILSCNALTFVDDDFKDHPANPVSPTLRFSHVCRAWRAILLESTRMWSYIRVGKGTTPELLNLMWANTGLAPIDINVDTSIAGMGSYPAQYLGTRDWIAIDALIDSIRRHPAKLHSLRLRLRPELIRRVFEGWEGSLDNLEDLFISDPKHDWGDENCGSIGQYLVCRMPALRRFWATGYTVSLACPFLSSDSLEVVRIYQDGGVVTDMIDFIQERSGRIHSMEMGTDMAPSPSDASAAQSTRHSPPLGTVHLKHFHLQSANWRTLVRVLSTLRISSPSFNICCGKIPDQNLHDFFTALAHARGGILSPEEVKLCYNDDIAFWEHAISHPLVDGVRRVLPSSAAVELRQPKTYFAIAGPMPFGNPQHYQAGWSFANLKVLTIASKVPGGLWAVLAHSSPLEVLRVGSLVGCYEMFGAIRTPGVAPAGSISFPRLKVLVHTGGTPDSFFLDTRGRAAAGLKQLVNMDGRQYALELANMLQARQSYLGQSKLLGLLEFRNFGVELTAVNGLNVLYTVAKDVVWDNRPWLVEGFDYERS